MCMIKALQVLMMLLAMQTIGKTSCDHVPHYRYRKQTPRLRVIAGQEDIQHPYVIAIVRVKKLIGLDMYRSCTGSVISKEWVLTAAHCLKANDYTKVPAENAPRIIYGDLTVFPEKSQSFKKVLKEIIHPRFLFKMLPMINAVILHERNDIGLLLIEPVDFEVVGKLSAIDYKALIGHTVHYVGTGGTYLDSVKWNKKRFFAAIKKDQNKPRQIGESVVIKCDNEFVDIMARVGKFLKESGGSEPAICLRSKCSNRKQRAQSGDSGGPLIYRGKIVGVSSAVGSVDAEFTPVSPYLEWIEDTMSKH